MFRHQRKLANFEREYAFGNTVLKTDTDGIQMQFQENKSKSYSYLQHWQYRSLKVKEIFHKNYSKQRFLWIYQPRRKQILYLK